MRRRSYCPAQAAASSNGVFIAVADRCRTERGVDWLCGSVIVRRGGYPAAGPVCEDRTAVLTATIDFRLARDKRISVPSDDVFGEIFTWLRG
jgi:predicted amidohydrolase